MKAAALSGWLYVLVFDFLLIKIITQRQLYQRLVRLFVYLCFYFNNCKNCNVGVATFSGQIYTCFCFFAHKSNARVFKLAAD